MYSRRRKNGKCRDPRLFLTKETTFQGRNSCGVLTAAAGIKKLLIFYYINYYNVTNSGRFILLQNNSKKEFSRLRKKLILYFILISVVSISVSAEIIFEFSSGRLKNEIRENLIVSLSSSVSPAIVQKVGVENLDTAVSRPLSTLRNRMILLLLVIFACIAGAFVLFTRDIVSPMDGIVDATKKIADGDLTVSVPVMSDDEIGQIARLINDMNVNLQDMAGNTPLHGTAAGHPLRRLLSHRPFCHL